MVLLRRVFNGRNLIRFITLTFIGSVVYVTVRLIQAPTVVSPQDVSGRSKSDYAVLLLQCLSGLLALMLPGILRHVIRLSIPSGMVLTYAAFLYCGIYLGEVRLFYYHIPHWDTILHVFSGAALGALGFSLVSLLNHSGPVPLSLSPFFVALFAFCFSVSLGVLWEIYEFAADSLLHTNAQRYAAQGGGLLSGQAALADTMKDLIVDTAGSLFMAVAGYLSLRRDNRWLSGLQIKIAEEKKAAKEDVCTPSR